MPSETALERIVVRTSSGFEVHSAVARPSLVRQIMESWVSFNGGENCSANILILSALYLEERSVNEEWGSLGKLSCLEPMDLSSSVALRRWLGTGGVV